MIPIQKSCWFQFNKIAVYNSIQSNPIQSNPFTTFSNSQPKENSGINHRPIEIKGKTEGKSHCKWRHLAYANGQWNENKVKKINIEQRSLQAIVQEKLLMIYRKEEKNRSELLKTTINRTDLSNRKQLRKFTVVSLSLSRKIAQSIKCIVRQDLMNDWVAPMPANANQMHALIFVCIQIQCELISLL